MKYHLRPVVNHHDHHMHFTININAPISHEECEMLKMKLSSFCQVEQKQQKWKKEKRQGRARNAAAQPFCAAPASSAR